MSTFNYPLAAFAFVALVATSFPLSAGAQSRSDWEEYYREYREYRESGRTRSSVNDTDRQSATRERYSSSIQREINKLDDDEVEEIPVPVMFGVALRNVTSDFGDPRGGGTRSHEGQDIIAPRGTPIASPTDAVVTRTGNGSSSGITVTTRNPGGETFIYMHLDEIAEGIKAGTVLEPGDILGFVGDTGNAKGGVTHLHFEIRDGRTATDPFPRLDREFTLKERIDGVADYLDELDNDDAEEFAETMVTNYRSIFIQARAQSVELPDEIDEALGSVAIAESTPASRDLTLNMQGDDVTILQLALIKADKGPSAKALAGAGATGYFGAMTQAALAEYQRALGITPASGYYGPLTRARMAAEN